MIALCAAHKRQRAAVMRIAIISDVMRARPVYAIASLLAVVLSPVVRSIPGSTGTTCS